MSDLICNLPPYVLLQIFALLDEINNFVFSATFGRSIYNSDKMINEETAHDTLFSMSDYIDLYYILTEMFTREGTLKGHLFWKSGCKVLTLSFWMLVIIYLFPHTACVK